MQIEQTELESTFWKEKNQIRTDMPKENVVLEPNWTHKCEELELNQSHVVWVPASSAKSYVSKYMCIY